MRARWAPRALARRACVDRGKRNARQRERAVHLHSTTGFSHTNRDAQTRVYCTALSEIFSMTKKHTTHSPRLSVCFFATRESSEGAVQYTSFYYHTLIFISPYINLSKWTARTTRERPGKKSQTNAEARGRTEHRGDEGWVSR